MNTNWDKCFLKREPGSIRAFRKKKKTWPRLDKGFPEKVKFDLYLKIE